MINYKIPLLPIEENLETIHILKKLVTAHKSLAELKGIAKSIPNELILINTLSLQEATDSSEIENVITTQDDLYKADIFSELLSKDVKSLAAKEVSRYSQALKKGFKEVRSTKLILIRTIVNIYEEIKQNNAGIRKTLGTKLAKEKTKETIYIPPQDYNELLKLLKNLEVYINDDGLCHLDPLIKLALIHHQFESIHPFSDGNGRTGRIINSLYLVAKDLLDLPILYMSRYINRHKQNYYSLLQKVRDEGAWEEWVLFILDSIEATSRQTMHIIEQIKRLMKSHKEIMRSKSPKIYSHELINNIFCHPYTKIDFVCQDLNVTRITATKYINKLIDIGILEKHKIGKHNYYINKELYILLSNIPNLK